MVLNLRILGASVLLTTVCLAAQVELGTDMLAANDFRELQGKRVGLLTNPSGVNSMGVSTIETFHRSPRVNLVALFAPEHGVYGDIPAGEKFSDSIDSKTGIRIFSLYAPGPVLEPTARMLAEVDVLVYDLQDTGARSYTFISTMGLAMEQCGKARVEFMVLDRPNPLGGNRVEGPHFNPRFRSLVGQWPIPYVYGLTCGELARMINGEGMITSPCRLSVVRMNGWSRSMTWAETGLTWTPTSPNVPRGDSPLFQVATGMLGEVGGVDIGIGTSRPFQFIAAPWLQNKKLLGFLRRYPLKGVEIRPVEVIPTRGQFKGIRSEGLQIHFNDPAAAPLTPINFYLLEAIRITCGRDLFDDAVKRGKSWNMFDKVNGTDATRRDLQVGRGARQIVDGWKPEEEKFRIRSKQYRLYE